MVITRFPPLDYANSDGLLAVGGDLEVASLLLAYRNGIFPWPIQGILAWFSPPERAILFFDELHISQSLKKVLKKVSWRFAANSRFEEVIHTCAEPLHRAGKGDTWITPALQEAYITLHDAGYAHSYECYNERNELIGGLYGVRIGNSFSAESMFYRESNASKFVLVRMIEALQKEGLTWIDIQVMSPHMQHMGAKEIPRQEYLKLLSVALRETRS